MTLQNKGSYKDKLTIYVDPTKKHLYVEARKLLKAEGKSLSKLFSEIVEDYVEKHKRGNPQQKMDFFLEFGHPYIAPSKCPFCYRITQNPHIFLKNGKIYNLCQIHSWEKLEETKPEWKKYP